ncbi:MAG: hypothetical protein QOE36_1390 [Gaiellaceae bacterium]|nr:hypothetical protein [Gaiellaceae bacterium]
MDEDAVERARERIEAAAQGRTYPAAVEAALERARAGVESLSELAARLEETLPAQVENAVQDGLREQVLPVGRNLAEVRGLLNQVLRRLERIETDTLTERHARVDDLSLLVDLITSGWKSVDERLDRLEKGLEARGGAIVYRIEERRQDPSAGSGA